MEGGSSTPSSLLAHKVSFSSCCRAPPAHFFNRSLFCKRPAFSARTAPPQNAAAVGAVAALRSAKPRSSFIFLFFVPFSFLAVSGFSRNRSVRGRVGAEGLPLAPPFVCPAGEGSAWLVIIAEIATLPRKALLAGSFSGPPCLPTERGQESGGGAPVDEAATRVADDASARARPFP